MATKKKIPAKKQTKQYEIKNFHDLQAIITEQNIDMIMGNFYGVMRQFLSMKKKMPDIKFNGFTWIDDGKLEIKGAKLTINIDLE